MTGGVGMSEKNELKITDGMLKKLLKEVVMAAGCTLLASLLAFLSVKTQDKVAGFDIFLLALSTAFLIVSVARYAANYTGKDKPRFLYGEKDFTVADIGKQPKVYKYSDISAMEYQPKYKLCRIIMKDGAQVGLSMELDGAKAFYNYLVEKGKEYDYHVS